MNSLVAYSSQTGFYPIGGSGHWIDSRSIKHLGSTRLGADVDCDAKIDISLFPGSVLNVSDHSDH